MNILIYDLIQLFPASPDEEEPEIEKKPDITQNTDPGLATAVVTWTPPLVTDNTAVVETTSSHGPGDMFPIGITTVIYVARDQYDNMGSSSFTVTVVGTDQ